MDYNNWHVFEEYSVYTADGMYADQNIFKNGDNIYEFEEVDLRKYLTPKEIAIIIENLSNEAMDLNM